MGRRRPTTTGSRAVALGLATGLLVLAGAVGGGRPAGAHSPHDTVAAVALSARFAEDRTAYAVVRNDLLVTHDGGDRWAPMRRGLDFEGNLTSVATSAQDPGRLYVATLADGVYRSTDAGASWTHVVDGLPARLHRLVVAPGDDQVVHALTGSGVLVGTIDGGVTWAPVAGLDGRRIRAVATAPDDPDAVWVGSDEGVLRSDDAGRTWRAETAAGDDPVTALAVGPGPAAARTLVVGREEHGVLRSTDGGATFTALAAGLADPRITDLALTSGPDGGTEVLALTWAGGVVHASATGDRWTSSRQGLSATDMAGREGVADFSSLAVAPPGGTGPSDWFVGGFDGLFRSTDAGGRWQELVTTESTAISALAVSPAFGDDGTLFVATYLNGALRSTDRGETWEPVDEGLAFAYDYLRREDYYTRLTTLAVSPAFASDRTVIAGVRGYLFTSDDGGTTWDASTPPALYAPDDFPPAYPLLAFSPAFAEDRTAFVGTDWGRVLRWEVGHDPTQVADLGQEVQALAVAGAADGGIGPIFAATPDGLQRSPDRGETWTWIEGGAGGITSLAVSPAFAADGTVLVGTGEGLRASVDGGDTWSTVAGTPFGDDAVIEAIVLSPAFASDGLALVSVRGLGLFRSTDGARTFAPVGEGLLADDAVLSSYYLPTSEPLAFSPDFAQDHTVFGMDASRLFRSTDAGATWSELEVPRATHPLTEASAPNELLEVLRRPPGAAGSTAPPAVPDGSTTGWSPVLGLAITLVLAGVLVGWARGTGRLRRRGAGTSR